MDSQAQAQPLLLCLKFGLESALTVTWMLTFIATVFLLGPLTVTGSWVAFGWDMKLKRAKSQKNVRRHWDSRNIHLTQYV